MLNGNVDNRQAGVVELNHNKAVLICVVVIGVNIGEGVGEPIGEQDSQVSLVSHSADTTTPL